MYLASIDVFLNEIHPSLKFIIEKGKNKCEQNFDTFVQVWNFLDVSIILHQNGGLETVIIYQETNSHDYKNYFSHHSGHTKQKYHTIWRNESSYLYLTRRRRMKGYLN